MSNVEDRLAQIGRTVPEVVPPIAAYTPAVRSGNYVYTSGQLPMVAGAMSLTGKVGAEVTADQAKELAAICAINAIAAVKSVLGDLDKVVRVVKVLGFVASASDFTGQGAVMNGASELIGVAFGDAGIHARSAVGVAVLPLDSAVEVEMIVEVRD
ncbi:MAG: RidA family protein [Actinomycetes bacterium]|jgi:enamine deaminase RidA (YjgF/YER057c/UK114 family)